jgi:hypothetical protein
MILHNHKIKLYILRVDKTTGISEQIRECPDFFLLAWRVERLCLKYAIGKHELWMFKDFIRKLEILLIKYQHIKYYNTFIVKSPT